MKSTAIIGAGPAGLTAAYELTRLGRRAHLFEKDLVVGGISRTVEYRGYRFDIGGHRFFTKSILVSQIWEELLGDDLLLRPRLSRIFYNNKFFDYPLKPLNALRGLGPWEAFLVGCSYLWAQAVPHAEERSFEQWVSNRFGRRLFRIFFKTYTEKVWGMPCSEISADWAAQRIKDLDLLKAVSNALLGRAGNGRVISTLIDEFRYPRLGPGMMWERCLEEVASKGVEVSLGSEVDRLYHRDGRVESVTARGHDTGRQEIAVDNVISSMPLPHLVRSLDPPPPPPVLEAAARLKYRDFLTVVLIVERESLFPDNWIYIHAPEVAVGRVQNFKNWSPEMVADARKTTLGMEYFVHEGDMLWAAEDAELVALGTREIDRLGLAAAAEVVDGTVVRMPKAYPVYDDAYERCVSTVRDYLGTISNLQTIGRNGQHRYNNQDHSMLAGVFSARNTAGAQYDLWSINTEQEYHEEERKKETARGDRRLPVGADGPTVKELLDAAFARYDAVALGAAIAVALACGLFAATAALLLRGGDNVGANLSLLGQYFIGFRMTWTGAIIGALEVGFGGFLLGYVMAKAINVLVGVSETSVLGQLELGKTLDPLEGGDA